MIFINTKKLKTIAEMNVIKYVYEFYQNMKHYLSIVADSRV